MRKDIRSLGAVMMELMEPETYLLDPHSIELKNAEKWKDGLGIHDFLAATQDKSLKDLKKVGYFPTANLEFLLSPEIQARFSVLGTVQYVPCTACLCRIESS